MGKGTCSAISWTKVARAALAGGLAVTMAGAFMPACQDMGTVTALAVQTAQADEQDVVTVNDNITENTTWQSGKTYKLSQSVSVKYGVTLTIEPGTRIIGMDNQRIVIYGQLAAEGAVFSGVWITSGHSSGTLYSACIKNCQFSDSSKVRLQGNSSCVELAGNVFDKRSYTDFIGSEHQKVTIERNTFSRVSITMDTSEASYIFKDNSVLGGGDSSFNIYEAGQGSCFENNILYSCFFDISCTMSSGMERNTFHGGSINVRGRKGLKIAGNAFLNCPIEAYDQRDNSTCEVTGNDFYGSGTALELGSDDGSITATGNYFGTTDETAILKRISDSRTNFSLTKEITVESNASAPVSGLEEPKHSMGEWQIEERPSLEETGLERQTCSICGYSVEREIPALKKTELADDMVSGIVDQQYTGYELSQDSLDVKDGDKTLERGDVNWGDYYVTYKGNVEPGTATVTITGRGSYEGSVTRAFNISKRDIASCSPYSSDQTYDETAKTPEIYFDGEGKEPVLGTDYDVTYSNNVEIGTASYTITAKGNHYTGTFTGTFKIVPENEYLEKQIADLQAQIAALKSKTPDAPGGSDLLSVSSTLSSVSKTLDELQKSVKSLEGSAASASKVSSIESSLKSVSASVGQLSRDVQKLQDESASKAEVSSIKDELGKMQVQLQATTAVTQATPASLSLKAGKRSFTATWKSPKKLSRYGKVKWQYRYRTSGGSWKAWKQTKRRKATVKKLKRGASYDFEARAKVTLKQGGAKLVSAVAEQTVRTR